MTRVLLFLAMLMLVIAGASAQRRSGPVLMSGPAGNRLNIRPGAAAPNAVFVASAATSSSTGALNCNVPAGTQNGDLILAYIVNNSATPFSNNTAWYMGKNVTSGALYATLQFRFASGEPAAYTWTGLGTHAECITRSYRNVAIAAPFDDVLTSGSAGSSVTSQATAALVATVNPNEMNVNFWANNIAQAITGPGGLSNIQADNAQLGVYSGDVLITAGGTVAGAKTATVASGTQMSAIAVNLLGTDSPVPGSFAFSVTSPAIGATIAGTASPLQGQAGTHWSGGVNAFLANASTVQPISFVADGGYATSATSPLAMPIPAACSNGNLMVMFTSVTSQSVTSSLTTPTGWTYLTDVNGSLGSPGYYDHFFVFTKYFSSDAATVAVSGSAAAGFAGIDGVTRCFKNVASPSAINSFKSISTASGQTVTIPALTETFQAGELYLAAEISLRNNIVGPNGFNPTISDYFDNSGAQDGYSLGDYLPSGSPGPMVMTVTGTIQSPVDEQGIGISILPAKVQSGLVKLLPNNIIPSGGMYSGNFDSTVIPNGQTNLQVIAFSADGTPSAPIVLPVVIVNNSGITFVGSGFAGVNGAGTCSVNVPSGTSVGDVMLGYAATSAAGPGATPAGWTLSRTAVNGSQSATLYWKIAAAGDLGASVSFAGLSSSECAIRDYHGVFTGAASPIDSTAQCVATSATTCPVTGLAQTASGSEVQVGFWDFNNATPAPICPGVFGNITNISGQRGLCMGDLVLGLQGVTPASQTATTSAAAGPIDSINATLLSGAPVATPPTITQQPQNQTVTVGSTATFTVTASGTPPLHYQWHVQPVAGGDNVVGTDQATYSAVNQQLSNSGDKYYVIVSNSAGSASTIAAPAILTVTGGTSNTFNPQWTNLPNPPPAPNNTTAVPALAFNSSIGATYCGGSGCCQGCTPGTGSTTLDEQAINYVGIKSLRVGNGLNTSWAITVAQAVGAKLILLSSDICNLGLGSSCVIPVANTLQSAGVLAVVEGINEPAAFTHSSYNGGGCGVGTDWLGCAFYERDLETAIRGTSSLSNIPWSSVSLTGGVPTNWGIQFAFPGGIPANSGTNGTFPTGTVFSDIGAVHNYNDKGGVNACPCPPNMEWDSTSATNTANSTGDTFAGDFVLTYQSPRFNGITIAQAVDVLHFPRIATEWDVIPQPPEYQAVGVLNQYIDGFAQGYSMQTRFGLIEAFSNNNPPRDQWHQGFFCYPSGAQNTCSQFSPQFFVGSFGSFPSADYAHSMTHFMTDTGDVVNPGTVNWSITTGCPTGGVNNNSLCHGVLLRKSGSAAYHPNSYVILLTYEPSDNGPALNINVGLGQNFTQVNVLDVTTVVSPSQNVPSNPTPIATCSGCNSISWNWGYFGHPSGGMPPPVAIELIP